MFSYHQIFLLESVKESGYVRDIATFLQCNPTGEFSLESIKTSFNPVHQSSPAIVDYRVYRAPVTLIWINLD